MQRVFSGIYLVNGAVIPNKALSYLVEGIQKMGGTINNVTGSIGGGPAIVGHLIILYEDNGNHEQIFKFLEGKEDNLYKWMKEFR